MNRTKSSVSLTWLIYSSRLMREGVRNEFSLFISGTLVKVLDWYIYGDIPYALTRTQGNTNQIEPITYAL